MSDKCVLVMGPSQKGTLSESYARAFERLGLKVVRFDPEQVIMPASRFSGNRFLRRVLRPTLWNAANREAMSVARSTRPDLIVAIKCTFLHPETVRQMRKAVGAQVVNFYPDNPYIGVRWIPKEASAQRRDLLEALREYDVVWIWEDTLLKRLRTDGVIAEYLSFGVDPEVFHPWTASEPFSCASCGSRHPVVFVGTYTRARKKEMSSVRKHPVAIWGNGWPRKSPSPRNRVHTAVEAETASRIHCSADISLNILNTESLDGHNMRTFEVPASGGVMLARYTAAQDALFPENEAAVYYRSPNEIDTKIGWLLEDVTLRKRIRGYARMLAATQTYDSRAGEILRYVGWSAGVFSPRIL